MNDPNQAARDMLEADLAINWMYAEHFRTGAPLLGPEAALEAYRRHKTQPGPPPASEPAQRLAENVEITNRFGIVALNDIVSVSLARLDEMLYAARGQGWDIGYSDGVEAGSYQD